MSFNVVVIEFPYKNLIGMKIHTDMQKAGSDCSALWKSFGPRIIEIPSNGNRDE